MVRRRHSIHRRRGLPTGSLFPDKSGGIVRPLPRPVRSERLIPIARGRLVPRTLAGPGLNLAPRQIGPQRRRQPLVPAAAGLGRRVAAGRGGSVGVGTALGHGSGDSEPGGPGARPRARPKAARHERAIASAVSHEGP